MDLDELFSDVVTPVLDQMLRPGELDDVSAIPTPTGPWPGSEGTLLRVVAAGEPFHFWVWTPGVVEETPAELRARLASDLQDFIAESRFGWAELRPYPAPS